MALSPYKQLELEWKRLHALRGAVSLLRWDAAVMMPRGSAAGRGEQLAALETECHAVLTSPKVSRLIDRAAAGQGSLEEWEIANLREMRRQRDHAIAMPVSLLNKLIRASAAAESAWSEARQQNKFELFAPYLEEVVRLVRDKAALLGQARSLDPYDALVDEFSAGVSSELIENLFKTYSRRLPGLVREVIAQQEATPVLPLTGTYKARQQRALINEVLRAIGFPFDRGRIDEASHAFTEGIPGDIRITYCLSRQDPFIALLGALHEAGHALYDLGLPQRWLDQPVGQARGMALEESQSLFLEMILGRSRAFVRYLRPLLEKHVGATGPEWSEENLYRLLTRVRRSAIRVDADELTYPLHVMLRFDLERRMLEGRLAVRDLREAWNEGMRQRLDLVPANDAEGVLQDAHWAGGSFGYFPLYMVGAAVAAQLAEQMRRDLPESDEFVARGDFSPVCNWLREAVHAHGARLSLSELMESATGKPLSATAALRHLERKYLENAA
ncbi:MAG: carboxypeptidase M32 [Gammaproteobacteria bacterium]